MEVPSSGLVVLSTLWGVKKPHQTAIARRTLSAPARHLRDQGLLQFPMLDYGCGRGKDVDELGCDGYDPHWSPMSLDRHTGFYRTILCTYVINVVDEETEAEILADLQRLLRPGGTAYITVRRDMNEWTGIQRLVHLDLPVQYECAGFCIYSLARRRLLASS